LRIVLSDDRRGNFSSIRWSKIPGAGHGDKLKRFLGARTRGICVTSKGRVSAFALLLLGVFVWGCDRRASDPWEVGARYRYQLRMQSAASMDTANSPLFDFVLTGLLEVMPLEVSEHGLRLLLTIDHPTFTTKQGGEARARFDRVAQELAQPFAFAYLDGRMTSGQYPKAAEALSVGILRNLAAGFQRPARLDGGGPWQTTGYDATGRYVAEYRESNAPAGSQDRVLSQHKLRYEQLIAKELSPIKFGDTRASAPTFRSSEGQLVLTGDIVRSVHYREQLDLPLLAGRKLSTRTSTDLELKGKETVRSGTSGAVIASAITLRAEQPYVGPSAVFDLDEAKIGGRSFEQVVSELELLAREESSIQRVASRNGQPAPEPEVARAKDWTRRDLKQFLALAALLRRDPGDVVRATALVRGGSPATSALLSGLGAAGTEEAEASLIALIREGTLGIEVRRMAALSLIRTQRPTARAAEALVGWLNDPQWSEYAELGLGTFVRLFGEAGQAQEAARFGNALVEHLGQATSRRARVAALTGLSNSGYVGALPAIRPYLQDQDPELRAAAVQALRLMKSSAVDAVILTCTQDPAASVRLGALVALENRPFTPALGRAVSARLTQDEAATVRMRTIRLLEKWSADDPSLRDVLERSAENDPVESIRQAAASALQRSRALASAHP
jgi:HEAT repeat protein